MPGSGRRSLTLLVFILSLVLSLGGLELALRLLTDQDRKLLGTQLVGSELIDQDRIRRGAKRLRSVFDPELGWISPQEKGEPRGGAARIDEAGALAGPRGQRGYSPDSPPGVLRVCAFGESFTHGDGVAADEGWPCRIEMRAGGKVEVLNFGVGGYGLDQAFLCFRRHALRFHPDLVLVGLTHHAVERSVSIYHPFYSHETGLALAKPRFVIDGDSLGQLVVTVPDPIAFLELLPDFTSHPLRPYDRFYDPAIFCSSWMDHSSLLWLLRSQLAWRHRLEHLGVRRMMDPGGEATRVSLALVRQMDKEADALGAQFAAVILPTRRMLRLLTREEDLWAPLRSELVEDGITVWDIQTLFAADPTFAHYFLADGHLSAEGNERVAAEVWRLLAAAMPPEGQVESPGP